MSTIAHSHMRAIVPEILGNMCAIVPKGSLFSFLVLSIEFLESIGVAVVGKRSSFERREADFYPTPRAAVLPLIPYLRPGIKTFAEPCAGDGDLVRHLESFGLRCVYAGDIRTGQDALALDHYGATDAIITNPPYTRDADAQADRRTSSALRRPGCYWTRTGCRPCRRCRSCATARTS